MLVAQCVTICTKYFSSFITHPVHCEQYADNAKSRALYLTTYTAAADIMRLMNEHIGFFVEMSVREITARLNDGHIRQDKGSAVWL